MEIHREYPCHKLNCQRGRTLPISFLVIHYVGALGGALNNAKYYGGTPGIGASAHYFVDHGPAPEIWQSVAEGDTAWHCGRTDGKYTHPLCRNANSIGIEMCCHQDKAGRWYFDPETVDRTVELARWLMEKYHIGVDNVVRHHDVTGKRCPAPYVEDPAAWAAFKKRLGESDMTEEATKALIQREIRLALADYEADQAKARNRPVSPCHTGEWADAKRLGLMDGTNPGGLVLREQLGAVAVRLYALLKEET